MESCLSLVSFYSSFLHRTFASAGLRSQTIPISNGETHLHVWVSDPDPTKPALLLLHGFGPEPTWQWNRQVRAFSRHFRLVVPDLVFFGASTTQSPHRSEIFQAECVVKLLDEIGVGRFHAVGTSYGGFVAYHVARMCGERVGKVVVASSDVLKRERDNEGLLGRVEVAEIEELMLPRTPENVRKLVGLVVHRKLGFAPDFLLRDVVKTLYTNNREEKVQLIHGIALEKTEVLEKLSQEVLIVWGEHDKLFPLEKAYKIKKQIGEKVSLEVIKNTSHLPQYEDAERFNTIVKNFLLGDSKNSS